MKNQSIRKIVRTGLLIVLATSGTLTFAQEKPEQVSSERARANFGRQIVLAADDVRAFPDAPATFTCPSAFGEAVVGDCLF